LEFDVQNGTFRPYHTGGFRDFTVAWFLGDTHGLLVVTGTMELEMTFHSLGNGIIIPTDEVRHFSEGLKPPNNIA